MGAFAVFRSTAYLSWPVTSGIVANKNSSTHVGSCLLSENKNKEIAHIPKIISIETKKQNLRLISPSEANKMHLVPVYACKKIHEN